MSLTVVFEHWLTGLLVKQEGKGLHNMRTVLPSCSQPYALWKERACHAWPPAHLLAEEMSPPCRSACPQPGSWLGPSPLLSGKGAERWRQVGEVLLPTVDSKKVILSSHLYHPMMDLLCAWVCTQCPNLLLPRQAHRTVPQFLHHTIQHPLSLVIAQR